MVAGPGERSLTPFEREWVEREHSIMSFLDQSGFSGIAGFSPYENLTATIDMTFDPDLPNSVQATRRSSSARHSTFISELLGVDRVLMKRGLPDVMGPAHPPSTPSTQIFSPGDWQIDTDIELANCADPVRVVMRARGQSHYRLRNLLLPDNDLAVIVSLEDAGFDLGDIVAGTGFLPELLSLAACP